MSLWINKTTAITAPNLQAGTWQPTSQHWTRECNNKDKQHQDIPHDNNIYSTSQLQTSTVIKQHVRLCTCVMSHDITISTLYRFWSILRVLLSDYIFFLHVFVIYDQTIARESRLICEVMFNLLWPPSQSQLDITVTRSLQYHLCLLQLTIFLKAMADHGASQ